MAKKLCFQDGSFRPRYKFLQGGGEEPRTKKMKVREGGEEEEEKNEKDMLLRRKSWRRRTLGGLMHWSVIQCVLEYDKI